MISPHGHHGVGPMDSGWMDGWSGVQRAKVSCSHSTSSLCVIALTTHQSDAWVNASSLVWLLQLVTRVQSQRWLYSLVNQTSAVRAICSNSERLSQHGDCTTTHTCTHTHTYIQDTLHHTATAHHTAIHYTIRFDTCSQHNHTTPLPTITPPDYSSTSSTRTTTSTSISAHASQAKVLAATSTTASHTVSHASAVW